MAQDLEFTGTALTAVIAGEVVYPRGLAVIAPEVAARQRSPETRRTYAAVYRAFAPSSGPTRPPRT